MGGPFELKIKKHFAPLFIPIFTKQKTVFLTSTMLIGVVTRR